MVEGEDEVRGAGEPRPRSDEIRDEIDRTRMELEETVDAIGSRLRPSNLAQEGWAKVKSGSGAGASRVMRMAREHPIPVGLIGAGLTWLVIEERRRRSGEDWRRLESDADDYGEITDGAGEYGATGAAPAASYEEGMKEARTLAGRARESVAATKDAVGSAAGRVAGAASGAGRKVGAIAGKVRRRASDLGHRTGESVKRAGSGFWDTVERRPIAAGLATLAAGLLVGLLVPSTRREDEWMGATRDELLRGAREAGKQTLDKTKQVARTAADAAQQAAQGEAERQKLMPGTA